MSRLGRPLERMYTISLSPNSGLRSRVDGGLPAPHVRERQPVQQLHGCRCVMVAQAHGRVHWQGLGLLAAEPGVTAHPTTKTD